MCYAALPIIAVVATLLFTIVIPYVFALRVSGSTGFVVVHFHLMRIAIAQAISAVVLLCALISFRYDKQSGGQR
jgi:hypothetical protein